MCSVLPRCRWIHAPRAADLEPNASQRRAGADAGAHRRDPRLGVGPARPRNPKNHQTATSPAPLLRGLRRARRRLRRRRAAAGEPRVPLRPRRRRDLHARVQDLPVALRRLSTNLRVSADRGSAFRSHPPIPSSRRTTQVRPGDEGHQGQGGQVRERLHELGRRRDPLRRRRRRRRVGLRARARGDGPGHAARRRRHPARGPAARRRRRALRLRARRRARERAGPLRRRRARQEGVGRARLLPGRGPASRDRDDLREMWSGKTMGNDHRRAR